MGGGVARVVWRCHYRKVGALGSEMELLSADRIIYIFGRVAITG
jgi:hypothetical protein